MTMKLSLKRDDLLPALQSVHNVVERRQSLPILANLLLSVEHNGITFTATDMEVETVITLPSESKASGATTIPARKLLDIVRALEPGADVTIDVTEKQAVLRAGRSRFTLSTMPAAEFPNIGEFVPALTVSVDGATLKELINLTQFAMAHNDVRYYLNGLLLEFGADLLRTVATDGHRLALAEAPLQSKVDAPRQVIVPRKGVQELLRLVEGNPGVVELFISDNHLQARTPAQRMTTKLIDGKYPDYERVLPKVGEKVVVAARESLRQGLTRTAILSNEKFRGVRLALKDKALTASAHNPEQEEAEEVMEVDYSGAELEIGFNATYLLDVLNTVRSEQIRLEFSDANSSCLITPMAEATAKYVVMPMRL